MHNIHASAKIIMKHLDVMQFHIGFDKNSSFLCSLMCNMIILLVKEGKKPFYIFAYLWDRLWVIDTRNPLFSNFMQEYTDNIQIFHFPQQVSKFVYKLTCNTDICQNYICHTDISLLILVFVKLTVDTDTFF